MMHNCLKAAMLFCASLTIQVAIPAKEGQLLINIRFLAFIQEQLFVLVSYSKYQNALLLNYFGVYLFPTALTHCIKAVIKAYL